MLIYWSTIFEPWLVDVWLDASLLVLEQAQMSQNGKKVELATPRKKREIMTTRKCDFFSNQKAFDRGIFFTSTMRTDFYLLPIKKTLFAHLFSDKATKYSKSLTVALDFFDLW